MSDELRHFRYLYTLSDHRREPVLEVRFPVDPVALRLDYQEAKADPIYGEFLMPVEEVGDDL